MAESYSVETVRELENIVHEQNILRPMRIRRYEPGTVLEYDLRGVLPSGKAKARLEIEKFAGGGFAGQVYKVRLLALDQQEGRIEGLSVGGAFALKVFVPPKGFSLRIRNLFYGMGFQGPFSLQAIPAAGRSQALWQKFIRQAAKIEFGSEDSVVDVLATLTDPGLGSCGELSEWVDGRLWRFEVDDDLDDRRAWKIGDADDAIGSPEYRMKHAFMVRLVRLMHRVGARELARQYEWWSLKSQPNVMKRTSSDPDPKAGLVAVDFRAGMTLTAVTPQCPADIKLVFQGLGRGRLVQFDKGDIGKLEAFAAEHPQEFADMRSALDELKREDKSYRDSLIDFAYHHIRLFGGKLRHSIMNGFRESWRIRNMTDATTAAKLERSGLLSLIFLLFPFLPLTTVALFVFAFPGPVWWKYPLWLTPLLAPFARKLWGRADYRRHYGKMLASSSYFLRAIRAHITEALIRWHRAGRVSETKALKIAGSPWRYCLHVPLSILPPGLHRFLTDKAYLRQRLYLMFIKPVRLYFNAGEREKWLREMISQGEQNRILTRDEAMRINSQIREPYIQKYLKSLAVHLATLFVSETVFLTMAVVYVLSHPELSWQQATLRAGVIIGALNLLPISPGSLIRGFYVVGLMIKERNFKDYNIAFGVSFLKMLGYLAFPIQMAYRYPDLARFMAGHWATEAVHIVPVFGERGAWLEHFVFDAFYNYPLTIRRRIKQRTAGRAGLKPRLWHMPLIVIAGAGLLSGINFAYMKLAGHLPALGNIWWLALWIPVLAGVVTARWAGGALMGKRILRGVLVGAVIGLLYGAFTHLSPLVIWPTSKTMESGMEFILPLIRTPIEFFLLFGLLGMIGSAVAETRKVK
jgi:hypothetical protein